MARSLNSTLTWIAAATAVIGIVVLGVLSAIVSALNVVTGDVSTAVESVHAADEIEVQLIIHHEARSPIVKGAATANLERAVEESAQFVPNSEEQRRQSAVARGVDTYLRSGGGAEELGAAMTAARDLSLLNVAQARQAGQRAKAWNWMASIAGTLAGFLLLAGVATFLVWLRHGPLRQIAVLSRAMERFSAGDLQSRAPEAGPRELAVMSRSFNAAAAALARARQRQSEFVATAIHDLRTPLSAIQLAVGYLTPDRPFPPEPRVRRLVELIGRQLTRMNGLIGDILNATWIEAGALELSTDTFDLRAIAATSVQTFRGLAPEHVIDLNVPPQPVLIDGDRVRLAQVLNNLLSNAIKYSPHGSRVRVDLARAGDEALLAVSDEGPGIAPEDQARIFEALQRQSATHEEAPGTSLGLWVSRRVVEAHAGRMELESKVGEGSTFRVRLPAEPSPPEHPATEAGAHPAGA